MIHNTQDVPNLTRIVVQGALTVDGNNPRKWLRLTIDPRTPGVFSWENVSYCEASPASGSTLPALPGVSRPPDGGAGAVPAPRSHCSDPIDLPDPIDPCSVIASAA